MAWANDASGRGWTAIFGGSSASATRATRVRSASARRSVDRWASRPRHPRPRGSEAAAFQSSHGLASLRGGDGLRWGVPPIDVEQSLDNLKLERDAIVLYDALAGIEKDPRRATRSGGSPATSVAMPTSGRRGYRARSDGPAARAGRGCASASSSWPRASSGPRPSRSSSRRSRATRRRPYRRRASRPRSPRSPPTSASTPRSGSASRADEAADGGRGAGARRRRDRAAARRARRRSASASAGTAAGPVGHAAGGHLRRQRRARQQPVAGHGRRRGRLGQPGLRPARRDRRPARRAHSAWPPASTSRCRASASCSSARSPSSARRWRRCPRRRRPSWPPLPLEGLRARRGGPRSPTGSSGTRRRRSTCSSARSSASIRTSSGRRGARPAARSWRSPIGAVDPGHPVPVRRRARRVLFISLGLSLIALFAVGAAVSLLTGRGAHLLRLPPARHRARRGAVTYAIGSSSASGWPAEPMPDHDTPAARLATERLAATRWGNGPGDRYGAHDHAYDKVIVVEQGAITFELTAPRDRSASTGDRLELPAGTRHAADVGASGRYVPGGAPPARVAGRRAASRGRAWRSGRA